MNEERLEALMVAVVDEVATPAERDELMRYLADHPDLARELELHRATKAITDRWVAGMQHDIRLDRHEASPLTRAEDGLGWGLYLGGTVVLLAFGAVEWFSEPDIPFWAKAGMAMLGSGLLLMLFSAVRWRLATLPSDRYTEVQR